MDTGTGIFPKRLTKFERARIIGLRALQLNLGAPPLVSVDETEKWDPLMIATHELESRALPLTLRRTLPDNSFLDIPIDDLLPSA